MGQPGRSYFQAVTDKGDTEDLVKKRRDHWLEKLDHTRAEIIRLEPRRKTAENSLFANQEEAELLRYQRESEMQNLERLKAQATLDILIKNNLKEVQDALKPFLISIGFPAAEEVFQKLDEAKAELKKGRALFDTLWDDTKARWIVIISLEGIPALVLLLSLIDFSAVETA